MEKAKVSTGELLSLLYAPHLLATVFPIAGFAVIAKSSAWIAAFVAALSSVVVVAIWLAARPDRHETFMADWLTDVCGSVLGYLINLLYLLFFVVLCGITMRHITELVSTAVLPKTPNVMVLGLFTATAAVVARMGIEVITRSAQIYMALSLIAFALLGVGISPYLHAENFLPVVNDGVRPILVGAIPAMAALSLTSLGIWCAPYLHRRSDMTRVAFAALFLSGAAVVMLTVLCQGLFSYRGMDDMLIPVLSLARSVRLGRIVERLDVLLIGGWLLIAFLAIAYLIYLAANQVAWLGGTRHYRPFSLPVAAIAAVMSTTLIRSDAELSEWVNHSAFSGYVLFHTLVVPLFILTLRYVRKGRRKEADHEQGGAHR